MSQHRIRSPGAVSTVEDAAEQLGCSDVTDVARAAARHAACQLGDEYTDAVLAAAALRLATARGRHQTVPIDAVCQQFEVDQSAVAAVESVLVDTLQPPASPETVRHLRRTVITVRELLAAVESDRSCAPYRPGTALEGLDPAVASLLEQPLDQLDEVELRAHLERLEADLRMARLGVDLYLLVAE
ncbi:hypothetical protein OB919_02230 [Halobacteria archaeon AArc-curdl1]|uniref:Uncharacterized protein n=1 Tax=Natronosalvus hydrolyticus TaxID=2979988 RepID=A0AAP3E5K8_9EURY|nr:hypothetical protein [Halobacteria archaeon AArc-curdl1]